MTLSMAAYKEKLVMVPRTPTSFTGVVSHIR
jgi:hypothetical protein